MDIVKPVAVLCQKRGLQFHSWYPNSVSDPPPPPILGGGGGAEGSEGRGQGSTRPAASGGRPEKISCACRAWYWMVIGGGGGGTPVCPPPPPAPLLGPLPARPGWNPRHLALRHAPVGGSILEMPGNCREMNTLTRVTPTSPGYIESSRLQ